ncbi:MAG: DCC1-like thiol-disulfide oxidoreductase family protein [Pseudomonadota bacterium]
MTQNSDPKRPDLPAEVFFDGACPVCRAEMDLWKRADALSQTRWRDVAGPDAPPDGVSRAAALARFHVRLGDGRVVAGARAFLALFKSNRRLRPIAVLLDRQPFLIALDAGYWAFLRLRRIWRPRPAQQATRLP